jgi:hypothetical protein
VVSLTIYIYFITLTNKKVSIASLKSPDSPTLLAAIS